MATPNEPLPLSDEGNELLSEAKCKQIGELLTKISDFAAKWGDHMTSVELELSCQRSRNIPTPEAYEAGLTGASLAREALHKYRSSCSETGFNVSEAVFWRILSRFQNISVHVQYHKEFCEVNTLPFLEKFSAFKTHLQILQQYSESGGLYKEPGFLPAFASTPLGMQSHPSPKTPGVHALVICSD